MFILLLILFIVVLYLYSTRNHDYWSKKNVKHDTPIPLFGNHFRNVTGLNSITDISVEYYKKYPNEKVVGYYVGTTPLLIVRDLDLARHILSVNFSHFYLRGLARDHDVEPLLMNLFHVDDDIWKLLRQRLTPAFTTAKLKNMYPLIINCAEKLQTVGDDIVARGGECDVREIMARFTTEFIGACGFGIEMNTINDEKSYFRHLGKLIFERSFIDKVKFFVWEIFPELRRFVHVMNMEIEETITMIVRTICEQRNYKPTGRNDFIDLLLELQSRGTIVGDSIIKVNPDGTPVKVELKMDLKCLAAQVFVFFAAGFETSSSATSFTLHKLAYNPEVQKKVQEEIDVVFQKYDNKLCYDAVAEMSYLDQTFRESMRLFPSLGVLTRVCAKRCKLPGIDLVLDPGVKIIIPIQAIQTDGKYFDNPDEFRPERFSAAEGNNRHKYAYMPFGEGPRACIGARLGHMQSLAGLATILQRFTVEPSLKSKPQLVTNPSSNVVQGVIGGVPLRLKKRNIS